MKFLVINGVNLNMLGIREKNLYGQETYGTLCKIIKQAARSEGVKVVLKQSNYEGEIVTYIQKALGKFDGIIINPGAYTHTSIAILDALKAVNLPTVEIHITDIDSREDFRKLSYTSMHAFLTIKGEGLQGYVKAISALKQRLSTKN